MGAFFAELSVYAFPAASCSPLLAPDLCVAVSGAFCAFVIGQACRAPAADPWHRADRLDRCLGSVQAARVLSLALDPRLPVPADRDLPLHLLWPGHFDPPSGHHRRDQPERGDGIPRPKSMADARSDDWRDRLVVHHLARGLQDPRSGLEG